MATRRKKARNLGDAASTPIQRSETVAPPELPLNVLGPPMTPKDLASFLKVSPATIRRQLKQGLPCVRVGQQVRFLPGEVLQYLRTRRRK